MRDPYAAPESRLVEPSIQGRRIAHSVCALVSGVVAPPLALATTAKVLFPDVPLGRGTLSFWATVLIGSLLAALAVYRHRRMPMWLAAVIGPAVVLLLAIAPVVWREVLGAA